MILNKEKALKVAEYLLQIKAVKLAPNNPFTWASGWKSPIYCDTRVSLSFPAIRTFIRQAYAEAIREQFGKPDVIAGVATGATAIAGAATGASASATANASASFVAPLMSSK